MKFPLPRLLFPLVPVAMTLLFFTCSKKDPKPAVPGWAFSIPAPVPPFDGERAFTFLTRQTGFGPRAPGTPAHDSCRVFLQTTLASLADTVWEQPFSMSGYDGETLRLTNICASFNPRAGTRVLLCAHWDSRPRAEKETDSILALRPIPGANDGASGTAVLLHIAEMLRRKPPAIGVDIVLFDGEDYGKEGDESMFCLGSKYYSASPPSGYAPLFGVLLDLVGDREAVFPIEGASLRYARDVVQLLWGTAGRLGLSAFSAVESIAITDDHIPLNTVAGIKTVDIIDLSLVGHTTPVARRKYWHTLRDTPEQCSASTLVQVGTLLSAITYGIRPAPAPAQ